jgi:hypothetical protein
VKRPGTYTLLWGLLVMAGSVPLWGWSYGLPHSVDECGTATCVVHPALAPALLSSAGFVCVVLGAVLLVRRVDGIDRGSRPVVDQSMTTAVVALGITLAALGGAVGRWLTWIGIGVVVAGVGGVVREWMALRALRRRSMPP